MLLKRLFEVVCGYFVVLWGYLVVTLWYFGTISRTAYWGLRLKIDSSPTSVPIIRHDGFHPLIHKTIVRINMTRLFYWHAFFDGKLLASFHQLLYLNKRVPFL